MPYFGTTNWWGDDFIVEAGISARNSFGSFPFQYINGSFPGGLMMSSFRYGSTLNSFHFEPDMTKVRITTSSYRKFLGYEEVPRSSMRRYRRKNGTYGFYFKKWTQRKKLFVDIPRVSYTAFRMKQKGTYLQPNSLDFNDRKIMMVPLENKVTFSGVSHPYWSPSPIDFIVSGRVTGFGRFPAFPITVPFSGRQVGDQYTIDNPYPPGTEVLETLVSQSDRDKCLIKLYNKIQDDQPAYFTMLAESGETLNTMRSIAFRGLSLAKDLYRLNIKGLRKQFSDTNLKNTADIWLEWVYGITPVVNDIQKIIEVASRESRVWRTYSSGVELQAPKWAFQPFLDGKSTEEFRAFLRYGVTLEGEMTLLRYLERTRSWEQAAGTIYELIPFSFMLDWLVDISGYLNSCNVIGGNYLNGWQSIGLIQQAHYTGQPYEVQTLDPDQAFISKVASPPLSGIRKNVQFSRRLLLELPAMPKPILPTSDNLLEGVSFQRAVNALAVVVSRTFNLPDKWSRSVNSDLRKININLRGQ